MPRILDVDIETRPAMFVRQTGINFICSGFDPSMIYVLVFTVELELELASLYHLAFSFFDRRENILRSEAIEG